MKDEPAGGGCLFCRIAAREVPADVVYEDEDVLAFRDIRPKYRVHFLIIPKRHLAGAADFRPEHDPLLGKLLRVGAELARREGAGESGFRLLTNQGPDAGQMVHHVHVHILGGEPLRGL